MEFKDFVEKVETGIREYLGKTERTEVKDIIKNNGVVRKGIVVGRKEEVIAPTIYLESFYEEYQKGKALGEVIYDIIKIYEDNRISDSINLDFFLDYESVKKRVFQKVINYEKNKDMLQNVPYERFMDLAVVCYYAYMNDFLGRGSIQIDVGHLDTWGISQEELFADARRNTLEKLGVEIKGMDEVICELLSENLEQEEAAELDEIMQQTKREVPMYIMTLRGRYYGAACILYKEILQAFGEKCRRSFYILPSSIHELILIPDNGREKQEDLRRMVVEVNAGHVALQEQLSDNIYYFSISENSVSMLSE